jgi:hypothetical protein
MTICLKAFSALEVCPARTDRHISHEANYSFEQCIIL